MLHDVTVGKINYDMGIWMVYVIVILVDLIASALLLYTIDNVAVRNRQSQRGAVLLARFINFVVHYLVSE